MDDNVINLTPEQEAYRLTAPHVTYYIDIEGIKDGSHDITISPELDWEDTMAVIKIALEQACEEAGIDFKGYLQEILIGKHD